MKTVCFAICNEDQYSDGKKIFVKGKKYKLGVHSEEVMNIIDEMNDPIMVCLDDPDFCYVLHAPIEIENKFD